MLLRGVGDIRGSRLLLRGTEDVCIGYALQGSGALRQAHTLPADVGIGVLVAFDLPVLPAGKHGVLMLMDRVVLVYVAWEVRVLCA